MSVRTRFAPSPTGFIHLGNIRSALYPWAFARSQGGTFILRIEDTDLERSSQAAVDVILEGMAWLGLDHDEGPFFQMQRMDRYKEVLAQMRAQDLVYPCYMSVEELDKLRERQMANKEKPRYDGTWRPEPGKQLPPVPEGVQPVLRFKNPTGGAVAWDDKVKGRIEIRNDELDDLVIARPDGTPTYNFCVVVDDIDMEITHVIRGDDEIFSREQFLQWFNLDHLGKSAAQFDDAKLRWVNAQHMKATADEVLAPLVQAQLEKRGITADARLPAICGLLKDRCDTILVLADWAQRFYTDIAPDAAEMQKHVTDGV